MIALEPLAHAEITLAEPLELGTTGLGRRRIIPITGGRFTGARLAGTVLPGGADWQIVLADGTALLEARYTLRTDEGALVLVQNRGVRHGPPEVLARLARGEDPDPSLYYMRTTPVFETAAPQLAWLNRIVCVGTGRRRRASVELDFYEVK